MGERARYLAYTALGAVVLAGAWRGWDLIGGKDWNYFLGQTQAEVTTLLRYGQFPLWNPWRTGGQPSLAQPETMLLSPVLPLALAVGTLAAFKLLLLPIFVVGCLGMHALAGRLGLSGAARWAPALVFFGSSVFPLYTTGGWPNWLCGLALIPWLLYALRRAEDDLRWVALAGLLYAGLLFCGAIYQFVFVPLLLAIEAVVRSLAERRARPVAVAAAALALGVLLAAPRVLPLFEVYGLYPRQVPGDEEALPLSLIGRVWLETELPPLGSPREASVVAHDGAAYWPYVGAFIGPVALLLAALGAFAGRAALGWIAAGGMFLWMALGSAAQPALWPRLHGLPVLGSMHAPQRLVLFTTLALAVLAGFGTRALQRGIGARPGAAPAGAAARVARWSPALLLAAMTVRMLVVNAPIAGTAFTLAPAPGPVFGEAFRQEDVPRRPEQAGGEGYEAVLRNVGSVNGISDIPSPRVALPHDAPGYRGEVFLQQKHGDVDAHLTPNEITVRARLDADDVLVVNQTWFPGWVASPSSRPLVQRDGLLALPLPAGEHALTLRYRPAGAAKGLLYGALAAVVTGLWLLARRRAPVQRLALTEGVALGACLLVGVGVFIERPRLPADRAPPSSLRLPALEEALVVGDRPGDLRDLQSALDAAAPDALILVRPGDYAGFTARRPATLCAQPGGAVRVTTPVIVEGLAAREQLVLMGRRDEPLVLSQGLRCDVAGGLALQHARVEAPAGGEAALWVRRAGWVALVESSAAPEDLGGTAPLRMPPGMPPDGASAPAVALTLTPLPSRIAALRLSGPPGARGALVIGLRPARFEVLAGQPPIGVDLLGLYVRIPVTLSEDGRLDLRFTVPVSLMRPGLGIFVQLATIDARGAIAVGPPDGRFFEFVDER